MNQTNLLKLWGQMGAGLAVMGFIMSIFSNKHSYDILNATCIACAFSWFATYLYSLGCEGLIKEQKERIKELELRCKVEEQYYKDEKQDFTSKIKELYQENNDLKNKNNIQNKTIKHLQTKVQELASKSPDYNNCY